MNTIVIGSIYESMIYFNGSNECYNKSQKISIEKRITLEDIFIVIKTTSKNHNTRLKYIESSWYQMAKTQVSFNKILNKVKNDDFNINS